MTAMKPWDIFYLHMKPGHMIHNKWHIQQALTSFWTHLTKSFLKKQLLLFNSKPLNSKVVIPVLMCNYKRFQPRVSQCRQQKRGREGAA